MSDFKLDLTQFRQAVKEVMANTKQTEAQILNRQSLTVITGGKGVRGAISRTPRADRGRINALTVKQLAGAVIRKAKREGNYPMSKADFRKAITAERARRRRAIGYTAGPGWNNAAKAFGGKGVKGVIPSEFAQSLAAQGYGEKATPNHLEAEIANTAPAADLIGRQALQAALNDTARDMKEYAARKLQQTFDKNSAR